MAEDNPTKPLTPPHKFIRSDEEGGKVKKVQQRRHITNCVGFCIASILIIAILITVLLLTVFRVKEPEIKMTRIMFPKLSLDPPLPTTINITAEAAMKNPNIASFRYDNSTTFVYYHGAEIGKGHSPPGIAKARRTQHMNLSLEIVTQKVLENPNFANEFGSGVLVLSSYTRLDGRVRIIKMFKKHVVMKMNCTITVNITSSQILDQMCKEKVSL